MRFYKGSLTRRLILDISIDNELEESIVIQLRVCLDMYCKIL
jgi:hypothetical protein